MANPTIYTRVYSRRSAGELVSGKAPRGDPLSNTALLEEFRNHANQKKFTALVSASDRIIDTLKRAFEKHYIYNESSADIWIAFIELPPNINEDATQIHFGQELAEKCGLPKYYLYSHEVVFEWAIPEKYVVHKVSLQTLIKRGLQEHYFVQPCTAEGRPTVNVRSTADVRYYITRELQRHAPWEMGAALGVFAQKFGARAPLKWISYQVFHDCMRPAIVDIDVVKLKCLDYYAHEHTKVVDFQYLLDLDDGIDTRLCDWWLSHIAVFEEWRDETEKRMRWEPVELWETWHDVDCNGAIKELSTNERLSYNKQRNKLLAEHEKKRADIEAEAAKLGV